ncbi:hypothetical protein AB1Y20_013748 [Prymnesium parvum]|uniref:Cyclic nucleotide-binding domain-containing protein n=1 Tax=Prymnesium parvum TaxID=97485 RepID=A0AB34IJZ0_PRYPA
MMSGPRMSAAQSASARTKAPRGRAALPASAVRALRSRGPLASARRCNVPSMATDCELGSKVLRAAWAQLPCRGSSVIVARESRGRDGSMIALDAPPHGRDEPAEGTVVLPRPVATLADDALRLVLFEWGPQRNREAAIRIQRWVRTLKMWEVCVLSTALPRAIRTDLLELSGKTSYYRAGEFVRRPADMYQLLQDGSFEIRLYSAPPRLYKMKRGDIAFFPQGVSSSRKLVCRRWRAVARSALQPPGPLVALLDQDQVTQGVLQDALLLPADTVRTVPHDVRQPHKDDTEVCDFHLDILL